MMELTVEQVRLNHLRKQYAFEKVKPDFYTVAKEQLGLHSTDYWTPYLSVWARIGDYDAERIFNDINSGHHLSRINSFRTTIHLVHHDNFDLIQKATGHILFKRLAPSFVKLDNDVVTRLESRLLEALHDGPLTMKELKKVLPDMGSHLRSVITLTYAKGTVVRATASHARSNTTAYALTSQWVKGLKPVKFSEERALNEIIRWYVEIFGPVSVDDISWWLALTKTRSREALDTLSKYLVSVNVNGEEKFMTHEDYKMASKLEEKKKPIVWFLPYEDHLPKAFIDRSWYLSEEMRERVFPKLREHYWPPECKPPPPDVKVTGATNASGEIRPSIWIDGELVGRWELEKTRKSYGISYMIFQKVHHKYDNIISERARELEDFVNTRLGPISGIK